MGKFFLTLIFIFLIILGACYYIYRTTGYAFGLDKTILTKGTMGISAQNFADGGVLPQDITCDGQNLSPALTLSRVPDYAKSLVLILDDADSNPKYFTHWIMFNISQYTTNLESGKVLGNVITGTNDYGNQEYDGPCPPNGETHTYYFRIYALDTTLSLDGTAKRVDLDNAMKGHIISSGELKGTYTRVAN